MTPEYDRGNDDPRRRDERDERIRRRGVRQGVALGRQDLRMVEAALAKAIEIVQFAHHEHAFGDEHCTPENCSVAEWLETTRD